MITTELYENENHDLAAIVYEDGICTNYIPDALMAALGPGITCTSTPAWAQSRTKSSTGSEMQGIPASLTTAAVSPACSRRRISSPRWRRLCS